ncbi:chromate transporter [Treponema sp.]|uniref:chromate transporter n=1 Tax=Treponema sp. TaxID=166 RepID=UPI0025F078E3|nr:chromate transporter [Treponema sp.]MCR5218681.1 chromate transporter [Treponema sp.]
MFKSFLELYITFFKIGSITFGGGLAMLPILERELVERKGWVSNEEILDYYAIGQSTPGIIAVNVATFVGHKLKGISGGIVATLGIISPSIIIITLIAEFISNFESILWVQKALKGINVAVAALLTYSVINLCKKTIKKWYSVIIFLASFASIYFFKCHTIAVILTAAAAGSIFYFVTRRSSK